MVILKITEIKKIKQYDNATVFYTKNICWVCVKDHPLPKADDIFIKLELKGKCDL